MERAAFPEGNSAHLRDEQQLCVSQLVLEETRGNQSHKKHLCRTCSDENRSIGLEQGRERTCFPVLGYVLWGAFSSVFFHKTICSVSWVSWYKHIYLYGNTHTWPAVPCGPERPSFPWTPSHSRCCHLISEIFLAYFFPCHSLWAVRWDECSSCLPLLCSYTAHTYATCRYSFLPPSIIPQDTMARGDLVVLLLAWILPGFLGRKFVGSFSQKIWSKEKHAFWLVPWH